MRGEPAWEGRESWGMCTACGRNAWTLSPPLEVSAQSWFGLKRVPQGPSFPPVGLGAGWLALPPTSTLSPAQGLLPLRAVLGVEEHPPDGVYKDSKTKEHAQLAGRLRKEVQRRCRCEGPPGRARGSW